MRKFKFLKVFNSPFIRPKLKWYFGKIAIGTPYFYPRRWVKATPKRARKAALEEIKKLENWNELNKNNCELRKIPSFDQIYKEKLKYTYAVPKKIGFDFVGLGYKTKWSNTDYRFEYSPLISFVFFKWQIAVMLYVPHPDHYWVCWLTYENNTDEDLMSIEARIIAAKEINPEVWTSYKDGGKKETIRYWNRVLKQKYLTI